MLEPDRPIPDRIATDLAQVGVRDEALVQDLTAGLSGPEAGDLEATVAADLAMSVLRAACALPQPSAEDAATFPPSGEIQRLRTRLAEARQDPHSIETATSGDLLRALLRPRSRKA